MLETLNYFLLICCFFFFFFLLLLLFIFFILHLFSLMCCCSIEFVAAMNLISPLVNIFWDVWCIDSCCVSTAPGLHSHCYLIPKEQDEGNTVLMQHLTPCTVNSDWLIISCYIKRRFRLKQNKSYDICLTLHSSQPVSFFTSWQSPGRDSCYLHFKTLGEDG